MALTDKLTNIGNAIRTKTGGTDLIKLEDMPNEILSIETGGSAEPIVRPLNVTSNGTYNAPNGVDGYNPVTVNVPQSADDRSNCLWATGTWAEIQAVLDDYYAGNITDLRQYFQVGDEREIDVATWASDGIAQEAGAYSFVIIGIEHDDLFDGSGKAALTIMKKESYKTTTYVVSKTSTTSYSAAMWVNFSIRNGLVNFKNALPSELSTMIKNVNKKYAIRGTSQYVSTSYTKLYELKDTAFILSYTEYTGYGLANSNGAETSFDGKKYEYFADKDKPWIKFLKDDGYMINNIPTRTGALYRSSSSSSYTVHYVVDSSTSSTPSVGNSNSTSHITPAFCI